MALNKNKTGIMAAISAATAGQEAASVVKGPRAHRTLPKGTVGSVRAGLGGIQEIETDQIRAWGPQDRLELTAVNSADDVQDLTESIRESGQQVPVLLRPSGEEDGAFEVIYGRRRILACQMLGIPVKALIRTLDDGEALMAKGLENAGRQDLSFYERARFAAAILEQGHSREATLQALSISKNTLSQLERVARLVPDAVGIAIGPAHGAGRPKWMALASAFEADALTNEQALQRVASMPEGTPSDKRLQGVLASLSKPVASPSPASQPVHNTTLKSTNSAVTVTIKRDKTADDFASWFEQNADAWIRDAYERFKNDCS